MKWYSGHVFYPLFILTLGIIVFQPLPWDASIPTALSLAYTLGYIQRERHTDDSKN